MSELAVPAVQDVGNRQDAMQLILNLEENGALDAVSLDLSGVPDLSRETWRDMGRFFGNLGRRINWYVGDWLNHGEDMFGTDEATQIGVEDTTKDRYDEAQQVTGLDRGTLLNISSMCRKIAKARRRKELGFWIHAEVAPLDPDEQVEWLQRAIDEGWRRSELRDAIREAKHPGTEDDDGGRDEGSLCGVSASERLEQAARLVWHQSQSTTDGSYLVPAEAMSQLASALGEE